MLPGVLIVLALFGMFQLGLLTVVLTARWAMTTEERTYLNEAEATSTEVHVAGAPAVHAV